MLVRTTVFQTEQKCLLYKVKTYHMVSHSTATCTFIPLWVFSKYYDFLAVQKHMWCMSAYGGFSGLLTAGIALYVTYDLYDLRIILGKKKL